jgi:anti-sigma28 factor (negative regulator of flagellin synthesis)
MNVNVPGVTQQVATFPAVRAQPAVTGAREETDSPVQDKVTLGEQQAQPLTYADPRSDRIGQSDLAKMLEESDRKAQAIIDLIRPLVEQQGLNLAKVASGEQQLSADPATIEAAKAAIADGGEFSVEKTAERILSFAKSVIGADPSRFDAIRAAVEKGFQQAQDLLGGSLPEISQKTRATIEAEFDRWKKEGIPAGDTVSLAAPVDAAASS